MLNNTKHKNNIESIYRIGRLLIIFSLLITAIPNIGMAAVIVQENFSDGDYTSDPVWVDWGATTPQVIDFKLTKPVASTYVDLYTTFSEKNFLDTTEYNVYMNFSGIPSDDIGISLLDDPPIDYVGVYWWYHQASGNMRLCDTDCIPSGSVAYTFDSGNHTSMMSYQNNGNVTLYIDGVVVLSIVSDTIPSFEHLEVWGELPNTSAYFDDILLESVENESSASCTQTVHNITFEERFSDNNITDSDPGHIHLYDSGEVYLENQSMRLVPTAYSYFTENFGPDHTINSAYIINGSTTFQFNFTINNFTTDSGYFEIGLNTILGDYVGMMVYPLTSNLILTFMNHADVYLENYTLDSGSHEFSITLNEGGAESVSIYQDGSLLISHPYDIDPFGIDWLSWYILTYAPWPYATSNTLIIDNITLVSLNSTPCCQPEEVMTSIFEDDFTDGDYTNNPTWDQYTGSSAVVSGNALIFNTSDGPVTYMDSPIGVPLIDGTYILSWDLDFNVQDIWEDKEYSIYLYDDIRTNYDWYSGFHIYNVMNEIRVYITNGYNPSSDEVIVSSGLHHYDLVIVTNYSDGSWWAGKVNTTATLYIDNVSSAIDADYTSPKNYTDAIITVSYLDQGNTNTSGDYIDNIVLSSTTLIDDCCYQVGDATVCGTCYNAKTNATLSDVDVSFSQSPMWYTTTSNTNGSYSISDLPLNTNISVNASKSGYWFNPFTISLPSSGTYILDLYLVPECPDLVCGLDARPSYANNTTFYYGADADPSYTLLNNSLVTLYNGTYSADNNTNINGYFEIPVYADGAYSLTGLLGDYVTRKPESITVSGLTSLDFLLSICPGDINLDTKVNVNDFILFAAFYNLPSSSPYYYYLADLNDDDYINNKDFVIYATKHKSVCTES